MRFRKQRQQSLQYVIPMIRSFSYFQSWVPNLTPVHINRILWLHQIMGRNLHHKYSIASSTPTEVTLTKHYYTVGYSITANQGICLTACIQNIHFISNFEILSFRAKKSTFEIWPPRAKISRAKKKKTFSLKFWILYFFSSGNSKKINLAPSKFSCGGNTPARYFPLYFRLFFRWELFLVKKKKI